jgi:aminoglycoside phosphotransferase (APT) family kinase protein
MSGADRSGVRMTLSRDEHEWIEGQCGGRIVDVEQQARWRTQHFVTLERPEGTVTILARSGRDPKILARSRLMSHFSIAHEARVLDALQGFGLKIPEFLGFSDEHQMILMECVDGTNDLTLEPDERTRLRIMNEYYEQLARLHSLDVAPILENVPDISIPSRPEDVALAGKFQFQEADYVQSRPNLRPEPLLDLGIWWLHANVPQGDRPVSFVQGDTGPGQFMYAGGTVTALIDWELAHVGDPMLDLGVGRMRNMLYPTCSLVEPLRHYEEVSGRTIDRAAVRYYTVMSTLLTPLGTSVAIQRMSARISDMMPRFGWDVTLRRGMCDALAEDLAIEVEPPDLPEAPPIDQPTLIDYLAEQLELNCVPIAPDAVARYEIDTALAVARAVQLDSRIGATLLADDLDDMGAVVGRRPRDRGEGSARLSEIIEAGPEDRLDELVWLFSRIERRREHLWAPLMISQSSAPFEPLAPVEGEDASRRLVQIEGAASGGREPAS